jgi:hypothetical protein
MNNIEGVPGVILEELHPAGTEHPDEDNPPCVDESPAGTGETAT